MGGLVAKHVIKVGSKSTDASNVADLDESSSSSSSATSSPSAAPLSSSTRTSGSSTTASHSSSSTSSSKPKPTCPASKDIPSDARNTWMDTSSWLDLKDFNCTFTDVQVGGLPIVGLNSTWDDSKQANSNTPPLNKPWGSYSTRPFRGVSLGGWLSLEPFITPSLFNTGSGLYPDEYTMCQKLGPKQASATLEKHYSTFITEADFKAIADAGMDHVRIPYSYWAVKTYPNDPYVAGVSWRYLLRGIEWARKHGLRVKLDLHAVPGSQNGWNHSGRSGSIDWIIGPDGSLNAQRTLDLHSQLSQFFAQDRYKNVIAIYGLVNEPSPTIPLGQLTSWTAKAYTIIHNNGVLATQAMSEALRGLPPWQGQLTGYGDSLVIDVHEYTIFDDNLLQLTHAKRINFACDTWTEQITTSLNPSTGFGPTMVGEWSQADTDCTTYLNGVSTGARWLGTFAGTSQPSCPTKNDQCSCTIANADISTFTTDYKQFLLTWAEAQMFAFEKSWGWFYWTWKTENAPLWSYQAGLQGGILPAVVTERGWDCSKPVPSFGSLPEFY